MSHRGKPTRPDSPTGAIILVIVMVRVILPPIMVVVVFIIFSIIIETATAWPSAIMSAPGYDAGSTLSSAHRVASYFQDLGHSDDGYKSLIYKLFHI